MVQVHALKPLLDQAQQAIARIDGGGWFEQASEVEAEGCGVTSAWAGQIRCWDEEGDVVAFGGGSLDPNCMTGELLT